MKQGCDLHTSTLNQHILYQFVKNGNLETHLDIIRKSYREKMDSMFVALEKYLPKEVKWTHPVGGMFIWVELPESIDTMDMFKRAIDKLVAYVPGTAFYPNGKGNNMMRLNFSKPSLENIDEGIEMFSGEKSGHKYSRYGNPTTDTVAKKIAQMEAYGLDIEAGAKLCSSGMAAISTLMLSFLKSGDKVLTQNDLYGGTNTFFIKMLQPLGIEIILMDLKNTDRVADILKKDPTIKMLYLETRHLQILLLKIENHELTN
jgi:aspartate/methionine/tyrosine aminotransferase